jgi:hypothetical protein
MKLTKKQINKLKSAYKIAKKAEGKFHIETQNLACVITELIKVEGNVDCLQGDGFGFTPLSNNDTHITISRLIELAENGEDIDEELILYNLTI